MNLSIFCAGYVGKVSAACLTEARHHVANMDVYLVKIKKLKTSILPILEPDLEALVGHNVMEEGARTLPPMMLTLCSTNKRSLLL